MLAVKICFCAALMLTMTGMYINTKCFNREDVMNATCIISDNITLDRSFLSYSFGDVLHKHHEYRYNHNITIKIGDTGTTNHHYQETSRIYHPDIYGTNKTILCYLLDYKKGDVLKYENLSYRKPNYCDSAYEEMCLASLMMLSITILLFPNNYMLYNT